MNAVQRVQRQERAQTLDTWLTQLAKDGVAGTVAEALRSLKPQDVHLLVSFCGLFRRRTKAEAIDTLMTEVDRYSTERVRVTVEITWGRKFNGEYEALTPGEGCYVTVMEHWSSRNSGPGFRGCPLGRSTTVAGAIANFVFRGKGEWYGKRHLTAALVDVVETKDRREPVAPTVQ